jgi:trans-aconitate 2-methyltransferase
MAATNAPQNKDWSATQYLKFEAERTRPSRDLLAQIPVELHPRRIIDLGCGPGNSTAVLKERYPDAEISGMDSSPGMIETAKQRLPELEFEVADLLTYRPPPGPPVDLYFSNAVFQWLSGSERIRVIQDLIQTQPTGAIFAFQVPDNFKEYSHTAMRDTAEEGPWAATLAERNPARELIQSSQEWYDALKPLCQSINIWHTYYQHVLDSHEQIVEWVKGTGLQPFLNPLNDEQREGFLAAYLERLKRAYPTQYDGKVLLRYPRLFVVTVR